jgi:hypothetical protein
LFEDAEEGEGGATLDSSSDYKSRYLNQYGLSFTIPSLYVRASVWYPSDPSYFIQVVNYVFPNNDEYQVHTHFIDKTQPKLVKRFDEIFSERITGCTLRLIRTESELSSIKVVDLYTFTEVPRLDHLNVTFSVCGRYFVIFSKENQFFRMYNCEDISKIFDSIRANDI